MSDAIEDAGELCKHCGHDPRSLQYVLKQYSILQKENRRLYELMKIKRKEVFMVLEQIRSEEIEKETAKGEV